MRYRHKPLLEAFLVTTILLAVPKMAFSHVGHGDEFQAQGGIQRVQVNPDTDSLLGIVVTPIAPATDGSSAVMVPATALVDANGKQLVFVQYENFYEPVEVTTGATKGELIEISKGLSVSEKLVTQGSLSLYAESRKTQTTNGVASPAPTSSPQAKSGKTQTVNTSPSPAPTSSPPADQAHAQAHAKGKTHSHDASGNLALKSGETTQPSGGFPMGVVAAIGGGVVLLGGAIAFLGGNRKKKSAFDDKRGSF